MLTAFSIFNCQLPIGNGPQAGRSKMPQDGLTGMLTPLSGSVRSYPAAVACRERFFGRSEPLNASVTPGGAR